MRNRQKYTMRDLEANYINSLINNTLTQSGANEVALGDSRPDNASALMTMREATLMPLQIIKNRFYTFIEETARIWAEFWIMQYGNRKIKISDETGVWYLPFESEKYKDLLISTRVDVSNDTVYSEKERISTLLTLFEKGIIDRKQLLSRLPDGAISDKKALLEQNTEVDSDDGE